MATLEVHDGQGRVEFVAVSPRATVLFGSDPACDVRVNDPAASPRHARMLWRRGRYKLYATREGRALRVNGKSLTESAFRPGDELEIGDYRIYLMQDPGEGGAEDDRTRVQERPRAEPGNLGGEDFALPPSDDDLAVAEPMIPPPPQTVTKQRNRRARVTSPDVASAGWLRRTWNRVTGSDRAPDDEAVLSSPVVIGLIVTLVVLAGLSYGLWVVIARQTATNRYLRAVASLAEGDPGDAIRQFDLFLATNATDPRASKARVLRGLGRIRRFTAGSSAPWTEALAESRTVVDEVGKEPAFEDSRMDVGAEVLRIAEGLATRAKTSGDAASLADTRRALELHRQIAGPVADAQRGRTRLPTLLGEAEAAVRKKTRRREALAAMDAGLKARSVSQIFAARDALVAAYSDLAEDTEVVARLRAATELIRDAVRFDASSRPAETAPRDEVLGPPTTIVWREAPSTSPPPLTSEPVPVVFALADGMAYALDGRDGRPLWQRPVGLSSPFVPRPIPGTDSCLLVDARHNELLRVRSDTGALEWRQALEEPAADAPLVIGSQIVQPLPSGRLLRLSLETGELRGSLVLGHTASRTPVADETGRLLYMAADAAVIFLIDREAFQCVGVHYLGQDVGSLAGGPTRLGSFVIVAENHRPEDGRIRVLKAVSGKPELSSVQTIDVAGWLWTPPSSEGTILWTASDRGQIAAYAIGDETQKRPFQKAAELTADATVTGPVFALAPSERELWASGPSRVIRADLATERARLATSWTAIGLGRAVAPVQVAGSLCVVTQQPTDRPGRLMAGVNARSGAIVWRTLLGAQWPVPPWRSAGSGGGLELMGIDGRTIELSLERVEPGGFVERPLPAPSASTMPASPWAWVSSQGGRHALWIAEPGSTSMSVRGDDGSFRPVALPARASAPPCWLGATGTVIVPGSDGLVYALDAVTGHPAAETFVSGYDRSRPNRWRSPSSLGDDAVILADAAGRLLILDRKVEGSRTRLVPRGNAVEVGQPVIGGPAIAGSTVLVATADGQIRGFSTRDLGPSGAWTIEAPLLGDLIECPGGWVFVIDAAGQVQAFGPDGQRRWSRRLASPPVPGTPGVRDEAEVAFALREGGIEVLRLADGEPRMSIELGQPPVGPPVAIPDDWAVPAGSGSIRVLRDAPEGSR
jgi:outer membrane protein assembly factor BamB/pSer/pThr/pTyr-binding forkhead associated (FHA) protein